MKTKAKLAWVAASLAFGGLLLGQSTSDPTLPMVPRGDKTGPETPSLNPAVGDANGSMNARASGNSGAADKNASNPPPATDRSREAARARVGTIDENPPDRPTAQVEGGAAVMDTTAFANQLRAGAFEARDQLIKDLEERLTGSEREIDEIRQTFPQLTGEARQAYKDAMQDLKSRRDELRKAMKKVHKANAQTWETLRKTIANEYEVYSIALTRIEAGTPTVPR